MTKHDKEQLTHRSAWVLKWDSVKEMLKFSTSAECFGSSSQPAFVLETCRLNAAAQNLSMKRKSCNAVTIC